MAQGSPWRGPHPSPSPLHNSSAWLVMPPVSLLVCASPALFGTAPRWPRPRGPKGAHLKEETKMNSFLLHSSLIRVLGAEQSAPKDRRKFPEKGGNIRGRKYLDRTRIFGQVMPVQQAGTVRQRRRPYKLGRSESRSHLRTAWRRGNTIWEESSSAGLRRSQKLEILPSPNSKSLGAYFLMDAYILDMRRYFRYAHIFWTWAYILSKRLHFEQTPIIHVWANILGKRQCFVYKLIFWASPDILMIFAISFAWFCCCKYLCIFSVFIYAFLNAPIFFAQLFWSLGLRLMQL